MVTVFARCTTPIHFHTTEEGEDTGRSCSLRLPGHPKKSALGVAMAVSLRKHPVPLAGTSLLYETPPQYLADQPPFLNAVAAIATPLGPEALLRHLKDAEREAGRQAEGLRYGPRPLDLDIVLSARGSDAGQECDSVPEVLEHCRSTP